MIKKQTGTQWKGNAGLVVKCLLKIHLSSFQIIGSPKANSLLVSWVEKWITNPELGSHCKCEIVSLFEGKCFHEIAKVLKLPHATV